jgi:uncharacterized protein YndB with AHSA1/START domain
MTIDNTDRIEKKIVLRAPRSRVWQALTTPAQFGAWFGVTIETAFVPGAKAKGKITSPGYEGLAWEATVERMEPEQLFSYRWHPYAIDRKVDYSREPTTLVEFRLEEAPTGTLLTIVESGFDRIPLERHAEAFRMNAEGWGIQLKNIERYVAPA